MKNMSTRIGMISLALSCLALILAIFPPCILENRIRDLEAEYQGPALSFEIKKTLSDFDSEGSLYINAGEKSRQEAERLSSLFRLCTLLMILTALAAVFLAIYSWPKERGKELCLWSLITVSIAFSWQYIGAGIAVSLGVLIFIMFTITLGGQNNMQQ